MDSHRKVLVVHLIAPNVPDCGVPRLLHVRRRPCRLQVGGNAALPEEQDSCGKTLEQERSSR
jgi:hypothetical protein